MGRSPIYMRQWLHCNDSATARRNSLIQRLAEERVVLATLGSCSSVHCSDNTWTVVCFPLCCISAEGKGYPISSNLHHSVDSLSCDRRNECISLLLRLRISFCFAEKRCARKELTHTPLPVHLLQELLSLSILGWINLFSSSILKKLRCLYCDTSFLFTNHAPSRTRWMRGTFCSTKYASSLAFTCVLFFIILCVFIYLFG